MLHDKNTTGGRIFDLDVSDCDLVWFESASCDAYRAAKLRHTYQMFVDEIFDLPREKISYEIIF
jgi:hypothetical protein